MKIVFLLSVLLLTGCGPHISHAYGASGKDYVAPDICQAVAKCTAAGETKCFYPQTDQFTCSEKK